MNITLLNRGLPAVSRAKSSTASAAPISDIKGDSFQPSSATPPPAGPSTGLPTAQQAVTAATKLVQTAAPQTPPNVDIKDVQSELSQELPEVKIEYLHTDPFSRLNGRLATNQELTAMIESFQDESGIPFGYIKDGCYARAHLMDESFRQHGLNYAKMFVRGDLAASNRHMEARWWYHVAPLVFVDDGQGNPEAKIIDPGFSKTPMDPSEWVKAMNQGPSIQVDLVDPEQYYPRRGGKPDSFSESLPPAVSRMQSYAKTLHDHRVAAGEKLGEFVKPSWQEKGCGGDFIVDGQRKTVFPEGVNTSPVRVYTGLNTNNGPLLELDPPMEFEVSAAWDNRPSDFDPYVW
ncbi:MAG: protein-glutamine glutaminase family protein [Vulcanimicrobiota bacterium]